MADKTIQDIQATMEAMAARETAEYIVNHPQLYVATQVEGATAIIDWCLEKSPKNGLALEFGIGFGRTFKQIAKTRHLHGFDSFKGLPEAWRSGLPKGTFSNAGMIKADLYERCADGRLQGQIWEGWFADQIPEFVNMYSATLERAGVDFIHLDSDLYSSACEVLDFAKDVVKPGTIILFDEYWNYPGWAGRGHGEHDALLTWDFPETAWEYLAYNPIGQEVAIRIKRNRDK